MENRIVSYAQNREDVILAAFFPDIEKGFYIDIGAHHPINDSVTKYFYEKGWRGINVEPNKRFFKLLNEDRPNDTNVNVGIADKKGTLKYREYTDGDGLSTFSSEMQALYEKNTSQYTENFVDHEIPVITLAELCKTHKIGSIQFLKVDIEGFEYEALAGNDWKRYRPEVICIEANHIIKDWEKLLKDNGYVLAFDDGLNEYYASSASRADKFAYVENAMGKSVVYFEDYQKLLGYNALKKKYDLLVAKQADKDYEFLREIVYRDTIIRDSRRFRNALIIFLHALDNLFLVQINRFNHPKRKHATKNIEIKTDISKKNREELLKIARGNDFRNYYTQKKGSGKFEKQYTYETLLFLYTTPKKILKFVLKKFVKLLRAIRHRGAANV